MLAAVISKFLRIGDKKIIKHLAGWRACTLSAARQSKILLSAATVPLLGAGM